LTGLGAPHTLFRMLDSTKLSLVTLGENTASRRDILGEWGWSLLARFGERAVLLDTGAGASTLHNARALGQDLRMVEAVVLSHGHYDHTGGLPPLLAEIRRERLPVYAHPAAWGAKYGRSRKTGRYQYVGIPWRREEAERLGAFFMLTAQPIWLTEDIAASGTVPMENDVEKVADTLFLREGEGYVPDPVEDDQALFLKTDLGLIVLLGCAHRGVLNTLALARRITGIDKVYLVLGGTHLVSADEGQVERTVAGLRRAGVEWLGVSHCTGPRAAMRLAREFGERFFFNHAGAVLRFPLKAEDL
jgi:7,8-dihydropterin-6-yl-methyl-4-(beta-D-ribofuranosyl)aminobenzene 5'-phosphate synthase